MKFYQMPDYRASYNDPGLEVGQEVVFVSYTGARSGRTMYAAHPHIGENGVICRDKSVTKYHGRFETGNFYIKAYGVYRVDEVNGCEITLSEEELYPSWE